MLRRLLGHRLAHGGAGRALLGLQIARPYRLAAGQADQAGDEVRLAALVHIADRPAAAASIGQVHRAVLKDGRDVAVKIQYPGIAEAMEADLRNAGTIVRLARAIARAVSSP